MSIFDDLKDFPSDDVEDTQNDWCSGKRNRFYGLKHTDDTKKVMSETLKQQFADGRVTHNKGKFRPDDEVTDIALYMRDYRKGKKKIDRNRKFITPSGEKITITDLKAFCRENGLTYSGMLDVHKGVRSYHKGYVKDNT